MTENNSKPVDFNGKPIECNPEELSTNFYWTFGREEVFNVQTTVRGNPTPYEILAHLDAVQIAQTHVVHRGGHAKPVGAQAVHSAVTPTAIPTTAPVQAAVETGKAVPAPAPAPAQAAQPTNGKQMMEVNAVRVECLPKPDVKAELKFFDADPSHKYAVIYGTKTATAWAALFGWAEINFKAAATFQAYPDGRPLHIIIGYTLSEKLNTKGNPYKDIEYIR